MKGLLNTLALLAFITLVQGQYIKFIRKIPNPDACLAPATGLTAAKRTELQAQSICGDAFEADENGRCYYICLMKQLKYLNADNSVNVDEILLELTWLTKPFVQASLTQCKKRLNDPAEVCGEYRLYKCMMVDLGLYPQGIKYMPLWNLTPAKGESCEGDFEDADICKLLTNTTVNHFEVGSAEDIAKAQCFYSCILDVNFKDINAVRNRFKYYNTSPATKNVDATYKKCLNNNSNPPCDCQFNYNMYKCMKTAFKEFTPTNVI